jgi:hypothetical protein
MLARSGGILGRDDALSSIVLEQLYRHLADRLVSCAFAHTNQGNAIADRHHVAALQRGAAVVDVGVTPPDGKVAALEFGVIFVDGRQVQRLLAPSGPVHGIHCDTTINPA